MKGNVSHEFQPIGGVPASVYCCAAPMHGNQIQPNADGRRRDRKSFNMRTPEVRLLGLIVNHNDDKDT
jgi:hypothetical protein